MKLKAKIRTLNNTANRAVQPFVRFLDSNKFLYIIIVVFILQALWIAFSFRYPLIYDEIRHVPIIQIFAKNLSPLIIDQPQEYDQYGSLNLTAGFTASLYHYLMSFPYRVVDLFIDDFSYKVVFLRALNVLMVAAGLLVFAKMFDKVGIQRRYTSIGLLFFTLLPIVPFVAAHVNYDNMLFLLTAAYLYFAVRIVQADKVEWFEYVSLIILGSVATLVKFTFLPIFAVSVFFIAIKIYKKYGLSFVSRFRTSALASSKWTIGTMGILAIGTVSLVSFMYSYNLIEYQTLRPKCEQVISVGRCANNSVAKRNVQAKSTKEERPLMPFPEYAFHWMGYMLRATNFSIAAITTEGVQEQRKPLPVIYTMVFLGVLVATGALLYSWRSINKGPTWSLMLLVSLTLFAAVFIKNYIIYLDLHAAYATQPRYLLSVIPLILVMAMIAVAFILRRYGSAVKVGLLVVVVLLLSQGGGALTHILRSETTWYWNDDRVISANNTAKAILEPIIKEN